MALNIAPEPPCGVFTSPALLSTGFSKHPLYLFVALRLSAASSHGLHIKANAMWMPHPGLARRALKTKRSSLEQAQAAAQTATT
jgi:hypothetical protein